MYIHEKANWWDFTYDHHELMCPLAEARAKQGMLIGKMSILGLGAQNATTLESLSEELVRSAEIEGQILNKTEVRSSLARRLGIDTAGLVPVSHYTEEVVEMILDATQRYDEPLTHERLFAWHSSLFPSGRSGLYTINVGKYRSGEMQVVSGPMGMEKVHYEAPSAERVPEEMSRFIEWVNTPDTTDPVLKAAIAHFWFVSIHPFDDGNGRIGRAISEMLLAHSEGSSRRYYSLSSQILSMQKGYYDTLERTQRGDGDITEWLLWFLRCLESAIDRAEESIRNVLGKAKFWDDHSDMEVNERQRKLINMQFDGFFGKLTSAKWAKIAKCSQDTALNDINDLVSKGVLVKSPSGGRSTNYTLLTQATEETVWFPLLG